MKCRTLTCINCDEECECINCDEECESITQSEEKPAGTADKTRRRNMKFLTSLLVTAALAVPATMIAQDSHSHTHRHHHYKVIALGTFGAPRLGPSS
jgi:hypothetical protein